MSLTMQQSLEPRRARGFWPRAETTAIELLLPIGAPLGRPAAMARLAAAQRPLGHPVRTQQSSPSA